MKFLYTAGVLLYAFAIRLASPFNSKAKKWIAGRKNWQNKLPETEKSVVWFHCASLGEFDQGLPLMNQIKKENPNIFLLVTFFSPSGIEHYHKRNSKVDHAMYLPVDTTQNARVFLDQFKPSVLFLVKYEFWCNMLLAADKEGVPIFSVSTQLREDQRFFKWYGSYFRRALRSVNYFFVQNSDTGKLLDSIGIDRYLVSGDSRYDRVIENKQQLKPNEILEKFLNGRKAIIVGSSWPEDEAILLPFIKQHPDDVFIIAPHNIKEASVKQLKEKLGQNTELYTSFKGAGSSNVLILDTIGHLASAYSYGRIAYVGGGCSGKLHNILEPAVFGLPVLFGPRFSKFPEAKLFIEEGIGFSVKSSTEVENTIHSIDHNLSRLSAKTIKVVDDHKGAVKKILDFLDKNYSGLFKF